MPTDCSQYILSPECISVFFFFSSRRRHTRSKRDWSSDVCSSDLDRGCGRNLGLAGFDGLRVELVRTDTLLGQSICFRSEERRVGKECRFRWWWYYEKKKDMNEIIELGPEVDAHELGVNEYICTE